MYLFGICSSSFENWPSNLFAHLLIGLLCHLCLVFWVPYIFFTLILCQIKTGRVFYHSVSWLFTVVIICFAVQKHFNLMQTHLTILAIFPELFESYSKSHCLYLYRLFLKFSSSNFNFSDLPFRTLICFECIFVHSERLGSNFSILHVDIQFSKQHLLRKLFFLQCKLSLTLSKKK
jgi:hypothetical protein